ncbi:hypothetical protein KGA66_27655 [Actinocrinis puniceicyclus]|uniref:Uridine kinase n=1 Tax=Actinocrinis puniceicyclus TaxID=977794 RepID=A0A8J7WVV7_9ACTN|nr:hypothetical protein [Actinocrinis puniceicyclus]MBS2966842.1 hypothetical protein [Actinocrinis puniceicyclus]
MLLFDGVFLLRPQLVALWEMRVFVSVAFEEALERARSRDQALFGSAAEVERRYRDRYVPAQQLYLAAAHPIQHADVIVYNDELQRLRWEARPR